MSDPHIEPSQDHNLSALPAFSFECEQFFEKPFAHEGVSADVVKEETPVLSHENTAGVLELPALPLVLPAVAVEHTLEPAQTVQQTVQPPKVPRWPVYVSCGCLAAVALGFFFKEPLLAWFLKRGQDSAVSTYDEAASEAAFYLARGVSAYHAHNYTAALHDLRIALQYDPDSAPIHRSMAVVLATLEQYKAALEHYKAYLRAMPDAPDAREVTALIYGYEHANNLHTP